MAGILAGLWLAIPATLQAQYSYSNNPDGTITITGYSGPAGDVDIPAAIDNLQVASIGAQAFYGCWALTNLTIPGGVTSIQSEAFCSCEAMLTVSIPDTVTSLGDQAFGWCYSLTSISLPASVTHIGGAPFCDAQALTNITVDPANPSYASVDGVLFDQAMTTLLQYPIGNAAGSYAIPNGVTTIASNAFCWCFSLTNVTAPNSLVTIGAQAFCCCQSLADAPIPDGVASIGWGAFASCYGLSTLTIPDSVTNIGAYAFTACTFLASLTIPSSITSIAEEVFSGDTNLTNVVIYGGVTNVGTSAFAACPNLSSVCFEGDAPKADSSVFANDNRKLVAYYLPGTAGWSQFATNAGVPTAPWALPYPLILNGKAGVQSNRFNFTVSWATNRSIVVEASTNLAKNNWSTIATNALSNGTYSFSDPQSPGYPCRFYRIVAQ